jgi:D-sedoheptulose 7-phosphate isomerase
MKNEYYFNYFKSIQTGLTSSLFYKNKKELSPDTFFEILNIKFNKIKQFQNRIFFFGNGASSAFANHMALDFSKNGKILARSLSDSSMLTALANDYSYQEAMVEFLKIEKVQKEDLIITISSSGNSSNIVSLLNYCKKNNIKSLALSGLKKDNKSIELATYSIYVQMKTYGMVECIHQIFLHLLLDRFMEIFEWERNEFQNMNAKNFKL